MKFTLIVVFACLAGCSMKENAAATAKCKDVKPLAQKHDPCIECCQQNGAVGSKTENGQCACTGGK